MKYLGKVAGYNILAILAYSILIRVVSGGDNQGDGGMEILVTSAIAVTIHLLVCFALWALNYSGGNKALAKAWLLSGGIVLVVGFSTCMGNAML